MRRKKRPIQFLLLGFLSLAALFYIVFTLPPDWKLTIVPLAGLKLPALSLFFITLFFSIVFSATYMRGTRHGIILGIFFISYLILRLNNLTHPFFLIMLLALFITLELFFSRQT